MGIERLLVAAIVCAAVAAPAAAQDFGSARIRTERLGDGFHVLFAEGEGVIAGNIAALIGEQGVLIIDTQVPGMVPKYRDTIRELGGGNVDFAINTHWHFDHADGNQSLGTQGTALVAQENSRRMLRQDNLINLVGTQIEQPAHPPAALPVITFERGLSFHFNGERIDLLHAGPAHTTGDAAVIFRDRNIVHLGDVFNSAGYPFIDADNGGSLPGLIEFCNAVLAEIDESATVIPGHGPVGGYRDLIDYVTMLTTIRDRMAALIASGASLEQVAAARPTAEWDDDRGDPASFIDRAYASMTR